MLLLALGRNLEILCNTTISKHFTYLDYVYVNLYYIFAPFPSTTEVNSAF